MADEQRFFFLDLRPAGVSDGGCKKASHPKWVELDDWNFSMIQEAEPNVKGGRPSKTSASGSFSFSIKHNGPALFKACANGQFIAGPLTFEAERGGLTGGTPGVYLQLLFNNAVISSRSLSGDEGQKTEHIGITFEKVTMTYKQVVNGSLQAGLAKSYDSKTNSTQ
jgi:type VI protein secretion system component Hcp